MKTILFKMAIISLLIFLFMSGVVFAEQEIMPLSEVQPGMTGIGKTVISGTTIEEFDVEVLGVLTNRAQVGDLILVRVSGSLIDQTGGIAAGMSGSPVYIDGKLIGAIGYGWSLTDHRLGMITPIETMLQVLEMEQVSHAPTELLQLSPKPTQVTKPESTSIPTEQEQRETDDPDATNQATLPLEFQFANGKTEQIVFSSSYQEALQIQSAQEHIIAYPAQTPLLVNGLSGRALDRLIQELQEFNLTPVETGGSLSSAYTPTEIQPGGAISVQLVRGDIDISALGTLTYRNGNQVLGFGHPFLGLGPVEFYLSGAEILTVIDQQEIPFKLGVPTNPLGVITQDRNAAVGGEVGRSPKIIPVNITVHDLDLDRKRDIQFQVVRDEQLVVPLVINAILQSIDSVMDRQGYGTSTIDLQIMGDKLPDHIFKYSNMYYSSSDIAASTLYDLYNVMNLITTNPFTKVNLVSIHGDVQVVRKRQVAIIEEVKLLNPELYPGDTAQVEVTLRPFRSEPIKQILELPIPEDLQTGEASLTVSGGYYGAYQSVDLTIGGPGEVTPQDHVISGNVKNLETLLEEYSEGPKNNELVVDILPYYIDVMEPEPMPLDGLEEPGPTSEPGMTGTEPAEQADAKPASAPAKPLDASQPKDQSVKETYQTDYVLEGSLTLEIVILEDPAVTDPVTPGKTDQEASPEEETPSEDDSQASPRRGQNI